MTKSIITVGFALTFTYFLFEILTSYSKVHRILSNHKTLPYLHGVIHRYIYKVKGLKILAILINFRMLCSQFSSRIQNIFINFDLLEHKCHVSKNSMSLGSCCVYWTQAYNIWISCSYSHSRL